MKMYYHDFFKKRLILRFKRTWTEKGRTFKDSAIQLISSKIKMSTEKNRKIREKSENLPFALVLVRKSEPE